MKQRPIVALDFDGTLVTHAFPEVGKDIGAARWLRAVHHAGALFILNTMRSGVTLSEAADYCGQRLEIPLWAVNQNPDQAVWTSSPKVYAHLYVDDAALGVPLKEDPALSDRPFVNWEIAGPLLLHHVFKLLDR